MKTADEIDRPIFIVGPHRSGTTLLYEVIGEHPDVGYFNRADRRLLGFPVLAHWLTKTGTHRFRDQPMESQKIWDRYWSGADDAMDARDATPESTAWYRKQVRQVLALRGASRFVAKYPRLSLRVGWIDAVFPDALFVHLVRDWRGVLNSTLMRRDQRAGKSGKWYGMRIPGYREMGDLPWEVVAGRQYRCVTESLDEVTRDLGDRFTTIRYEDLCANPVPTLKKILERVDLRWLPEFEASLPEFQSANRKWKERLDPEILERVRAEAPEFFARHETED